MALAERAEDEDRCRRIAQPSESLSSPSSCASARRLWKSKASVDVWCLLAGLRMVVGVENVE